MKRLIAFSVDDETGDGGREVDNRCNCIGRSIYGMNVNSHIYNIIMVRIGK